MDQKRKRPLTIPTQIEVIDGVEWLTFVYTAKGVSTNYRIRIDTDTVNLATLSTEFKNENSVYPKANIDRSEYKGNRWEYETTVNEIGWKLSHLNQPLLVGKRGLLQRAVDRNRFPDSKSRRVARVEKGMAIDGKKRKKIKAPVEEDPSAALLELAGEGSPLPPPPNEPVILPKLEGLDALAAFVRDIPEAKPPIPEKVRSTLIGLKARPDKKESRSRQTTKLVVETVRKSSPYQLKLQMNIDTIPDDIPRDFILKNQPFHKPKTQLQIKANSIAWKLAYLNPELDGNLELIQRCVDVYMERFESDFVPRRGKVLMNMFFPSNS